MRVYPWRQKDNQGDRKLVMKAVTSLSTIFRIVGGVLSLGVGSLTGLILVRRFAKRNDSWAKRGAILSLIGLLIFIALGGPSAWAGALNGVLLSFGDKATTTPTVPLITFITRTVFFGFFFQGFAVMMSSYVYEVTGDRYLDRVKPTLLMKRRVKKNEVALKDNKKPTEDSIAFGIIVDDPIPWRTDRHGMICARPLTKIGHGVMVGGNGTGKTVLAVSLAYQFAMLDNCVFYIDFKASLRTLEAVKATAVKAGKKFYSFDLGTGSTESSWFDPLDWPGTASEKASMLVNSFNFSEDGSASYYRGQANDWLILQFDVISEVGLYAGESSFDFLLETANPAVIKERIMPLRGGTPRQKELYKVYLAKVEMFKVQDLSALRQNLSVVVNSGGERLRPQSDSPAILMSRAVEEGAVIYFGLSPATDQVALKIVGSLILRNLGVLAGERMRQTNLSELRPILAIVDEASRLQDRAVVMDNLFATAREAEIFLWVVTQSFATWPKSTIVEMNTNVQTHVAFRVQDVETAEHLVSTLGDVPVLTEMTEDKVRHRAFQGDVKERSGDARTTLGVGPFLSDAPMEITSIEDLHAYVWFTGSWTRATIEKWTPRRLKKPDSIRNDAPLVRLVFMNYETEAEPIKGSSFSDMVTNADEITYNMQNTTLKRTRRDSLVEEDYSSIQLPGVVGGDPLWNDDSAGPPQDYDQQWGVSNSGRNTETPNAEPIWSGDPEPQWEGALTPANGPGNVYSGAPSNDGLSWDDSGDAPDDDAPPVSHFYKSGSKAIAHQVDTAETRTGSSVQKPSFSQDNNSHKEGTKITPQSAPADLAWDDDSTAPHSNFEPPASAVVGSLGGSGASASAGGSEGDGGEFVWHDELGGDAFALEVPGVIHGGVAPAEEALVEEVVPAVSSEAEEAVSVSGVGGAGVPVKDASSGSVVSSSGVSGGGPASVSGVGSDYVSVPGPGTSVPDVEAIEALDTVERATGDGAESEVVSGPVQRTRPVKPPVKPSVKAPVKVPVKRPVVRGKKNASDDWS